MNKKNIFVRLETVYLNYLWNYKWHWWEYFEHVLTIIRWRMTNKGWNGK